MSRVAIVYGAAGYTGSLVSRELSRRGIEHVVAGRTSRDLGDLARLAGADYRVFATDDETALGAGLSDAKVLLNCAGPFDRTAAPLARACITHGVTYLDLAGEVDEHLATLALDAEARRARVTLVPGVGFGVVPTEVACALAVAKLGGRATSLTIAYETVGEASRGTLATVLGRLHEPGVVRREGALHAARAFTESARMDLGDGETLVVSNPWRADLVSAFVSLGVPEISTFATFPASARWLGKNPGFLSSRFGRWLVRRIVDGAPRGPSAESLARGLTRVRVAATHADGRRAEVRVRGPEAYVFTARTAAEAVARCLAGLDRAGFATPSQAFGRDVLSSIEGVEVSA